jgi:O-antigen biosynthesis protein WbqP
MFSRFFSFSLLILFSPILILASLIIFIEDGFPIIFKQQRVGLNRKIFWIYKFRSMKKNTPNVSKESLQDPSSYYLNCGLFIRDFSIDELPNLINILKGEMNFIGPRPALYNEYELINKREQLGVNNLKPGITGWAQVNGRDYLTNEIKCKYDKEYLDRKSFLFNLKIILLTFWAVAKPIYMWFKRIFKIQIIP